MRGRMTNIRRLAGDGAGGAAPQPRRVEILDQERLLDGFFQIDKVRLRHERHDGAMSQPLVRLVFERGDSAAVLPYDPERGTVVLVEQFRCPAYVRGGPGWLWEMIAGAQDGGRTPEEVARAEAWEEAGYRLGPLEHIATVYPSPGGASERMYLYLAPITAADRQAPGGGLPETGEDILVREFSLEEALALLADGRIMDAKTVIALQYLALHRDRLRVP